MHVEIWSDIACPWYYVGKRRFEAALAAFDGRDGVEVTWRSFELDPAAEEHAGDRADLLAEKSGMTREQASARLASLAELAGGEGLTLRFDLTRGGNTFDAHRLVHLAAVHGLQDAVEERLLAAYHSEGASIGDPAVLRRLAVEAGLAEDDVAEVLAGNRYAAEVREDERLGRALGITGVPFFVVDRGFGAAGAQAPETLLELLIRAREAAAAEPPQAAARTTA